MTTESLEELRERLIRNESVQQMIRARAYEIYRLRGGQPGGESHDWLQAEGEVLAFLIANEPNEIEVAAPQAPPVSKPSETKSSKKARSVSTSKPNTTKKSAPRKTLAKGTARRGSTESKTPPKRARKRQEPEKGTH